MNLDDYNYSYDKSIIASYPLKRRDESKLLVYNKNKIIDSKFYNITNYLTSDTILFFNDTKVIKGRIKIKKDTGAKIELLLINSENPHLSYKFHIYYSYYRPFFSLRGPSC